MHAQELEHNLPYQANPSYITGFRLHGGMWQTRRWQHYWTEVVVKFQHWFSTWVNNILLTKTMQSFLVEAVRTETYTRTQTEISLAASSFFQALHQADSQGEFPARLARKSPCASLMSSRSYHFRSIDFSSVSLIKMAEQIVPPVEGYPKLACHMGRYAQSAIFRRFGGKITKMPPRTTIQSPTLWQKVR